MHEVKCVRGKDCFSVAFMFCCLETTAIVDSVTDWVVPPVATNKKEVKCQEEHAAIHMANSVPNSAFNLAVMEAQLEWKCLMRSMVGCGQ